jgi:hypothetical protein
MAATNSNAINYFSPAKWVVSTVAGQGTHTTLAGALAVASTGDTIVMMPGTYTANNTIGIACNITAFDGDGLGNVIINGTLTVTAAITVELSNLFLQTNSAPLLAVTGSTASVVNLTNCYLNCSNNTGITFSSSSASAAINLYNCNGNIGTSGIGYFAHSSTGILTFENGIYLNTGLSVTASTVSGTSGGTYCNLNMYNTYFQATITISNGAYAFIANSQINLSSIGPAGSQTNGTGLTTTSVGVVTIVGSTIAGGTTSGLTITSPGSVNIYNSTLQGASEGATGTGAITYSNLTLIGSEVINVTSQTGGVAPGGRFQTPSVGYIGEVLSHSATGISVSSATATNITSLTLTAGNWLVFGTAVISATTSVVSISVGVNAASATFTTIGVDYNQLLGLAGTAPISLTAPPQTINVSSSTTYYLNIDSSFTGTGTGAGYMKAVRIG